MSLKDEIEKYAATVSTDSYSMSIGELVSMYRDGEIDIHPEFQRFFRWDEDQKSRLVESLLLDIPIPPIYVSERGDSKWDVIDGLQRLSTIFEVMGELIGDDGSPKQALVLSRTKYLPSLSGKHWGTNDGEDTIHQSARIKIKRARIDVSIIKNSSDEIAKYEMFQRLNTGGSKATDQEVRSCIVLMQDKDFLKWMQDLAGGEEFNNCMIFSDKQKKESYDLELVTRFLVLATAPKDKLESISELGDFLTTELVEMIVEKRVNWEIVGVAFKRVFAQLSRCFDENAFRKYNHASNKYSGSSLISLFEVLAIGLGRYYLINDKELDDQILTERHKSLWDNISGTIDNRSIGSGVRASTRIPKTVIYGEHWVQDED